MTQEVALTEEQVIYLHNVLYEKERALELFLSKWRSKLHGGSAKRKAEKKLKDGRERKETNGEILEILEHHMEMIE